MTVLYNGKAEKYLVEDKYSLSPKDEVRLGIGHRA